MFGLETTYVTEFDIAAIMLNSMLLYTIFMRKTFPTKSCQYYKILLVFNLISSVSDFVSAYTICSSDIFPLWLNYIINMIYVMAHNLSGIFFMLVVITAIRGNTGNLWERWTWHLMIAYDFVTIASTPWTHFIFYFDGNFIYKHGSGFWTLYILAAMGLTYSAFLIIKHSSIMSRFQLATDIGFIILILCSLLFQKFYPNYLIENLCVAIACIMMNVALDNPATYFYNNTDCFNMNAFNSVVTEKMNQKKEFSIIAFTFDDISIIKKKNSFEDFEILMRNTIRRSQKAAGRKNTFVLQDSTFAFIVDGKDTDVLVERLEKALAQPYKFQIGIGVTLTPHFCKLSLPGEAKNANDVNLIINDMLNHVYKKTGRHMIWDTSNLLADIHREETIIHCLRDAIKNDGIRVLYQPIYDTESHKFKSCEALVRLRDNNLNLYPEEFIPIAEQNGLINDIGANVLNQVCRFLHESKCEDFGIMHINVNLSVLQLARRSSVEEIIETCKRWEIKPNRIVFEITETASSNSGQFIENAKMLTDAGFALSLDDYGSGFSSISNLLKFDFNQIKIEKTLLWEGMKDRKSEMALINTIKLIQNLGKTCVVEGVESREMEDKLTGLGVDSLQGYLFSKPISAISLLAFLKENNS